MTRTLQASNILAFIVMIVMNYLSNTGVFNGNTMATVSAQYQNLFTPAGYAFSIWGIIYFALALFIFYQSRGLFSKAEPRAIVSRIGWLFVLSCAANSVWVIAWLYLYTGLSVLIMTVLLASLVGIVLRTRMELDLISFKRVLFEWWPFAFYLGWICVAIIANVAAYLTKTGWDGFGISDTAWAVVMMIIAAAVYLVLIFKRNLRESASIGVWGLIAVGVANMDKNETVMYAAFIISGFIFVCTGIHGFINRDRPFIREWPREE